MPDLRSSAKNEPPQLRRRQEPPEEELDVLEIEPTPLWKRALVASLVALVLGGITSVVLYPDMYKGLFSFSFFKSGPSVSRFASERPSNASHPKPKINPAHTNVAAATGEAVDAQVSETEQTGTRGSMERGDSPSPEEVSNIRTPTRSPANRTGSRTTNPTMTPRPNRRGNSNGFRSEVPGARRQPAVRQPSVSPPAVIPKVDMPVANATVAANSNEAIATTEQPPVSPPVSYTHLTLPTIYAV